MPSNRFDYDLPLRSRGMVWKVVVGQVIGPSHVRTCEPCQDAYRWCVEGEQLTAIVSDGAGSAREGLHGANIVCETLSDHFRDQFRKDNFPSSSNSAYHEVAGGIRKARKVLLEKVTDEYLEYKGPTIEQFHATVVGVIAKAQTGYFFHIGDGSAAAVKGCSWTHCTISPPENGEFIDETFFFTLDNWQVHLRITKFCFADLLILMSDGVTPFALTKDHRGLDSPFIDPVTSYLDQVDPDAGASALAATLDTARAREISQDDKTMLWARWIE